jgi:hypothetical protein
MITTDEAFIDAITAEVEAAGPDFVYQEDPFQTCDYVRDGQPSCLIGRALARLGMSVEELKTFDANDLPNPTNIRNPSAAGIMYSLGFSERVTAAADVAQGLQDSCRTWGRALEVFHQTYGAYDF